MERNTLKNATALVMAFVALGSGGIWICNSSAAEGRANPQARPPPAPSEFDALADPVAPKPKPRGDAKRAMRTPRSVEASRSKEPRAGRNLVKKRIKFAL